MEQLQKIVYLLYHNYILEVKQTLTRRPQDVKDLTLNRNFFLTHKTEFNEHRRYSKTL